MKLLNLPLNFLFDLYFAFEKFAENTKNVIAYFFYVLEIFSFDLLEQLCGHFLATLRNNEINKAFIGDSLQIILDNQIYQKGTVLIR